MIRQGTKEEEDDMEEETLRSRLARYAKYLSGSTLAVVVVGSGWLYYDTMYKDE